MPTLILLDGEDPGISDIISRLEEGIPVTFTDVTVEPGPRQGNTMQCQVVGLNYDQDELPPKKQSKTKDENKNEGNFDQGQM